MSPAQRLSYPSSSCYSLYNLAILASLVIFTFLILALLVASSVSPLLLLALFVHGPPQAQFGHVHSGLSQMSLPLPLAMPSLISKYNFSSTKPRSNHTFSSSSFSSFHSVAFTYSPVHILKAVINSLKIIFSSSTLLPKNFMNPLFLIA